MSVNSVDRSPVAPKISGVETSASTHTTRLQTASIDKSPLTTAIENSKQAILGFNEVKGKLSDDERASLHPALAVLRDVLNEISGDSESLEFTDNDNSKKLKELSFALHLHAKQFKTYVDAHTNASQGKSTYHDLINDLGRIFDELAKGIDQQAKTTDEENQNIAADTDSAVTSLRVKTFEMSVRAAGKSLTTETQEVLKILISLTKGAWQDSCKAEAQLKSAFNFIDMNSAAIKNLNDIKTDLDAKINSLKNHINKYQVALDELGDEKSITAESKLILAHMEKIQKQLAIQIEAIKDYQSPDTPKKICNAKKIEIQATINVLRSQKTQTTEIKSLIDTLEKRLASLNDFPNNEYEKNFTSAQLLGKKEIKGIGKVFNFSLANKQESMLRHMANQITDPNNPDSSSLATEHFTERMLMQSVLEKAGIKDASKQLKASISRELNSSEWSIIESKFTVPVEDNAHQSQAGAIVTTTTKHAGEIFTDPTLIQITSADSPITDSITKEYTHTDKAGKTVTGGFNSHCSTEVQHVTTAATTSCTVNGEEVFGATRHGTLAPYGLDEAGIKAISDEELGKTIHALFGKAEVENTTVTAGAVNQTNADTSVATQKNSNDPLREEFINELSNILLAAGNDQRYPEKMRYDIKLITTNIQNYPAAMKQRIEQLMTDKFFQSTLAGLVKANPVLGQLLQRQGALNRAREVFILEMTRNPQFLEQIKKGEEVLFTSVGLLTPDNLRHQLHKLFGFSASGDEKEMVAIQAQAWKDLRTEIAAGRIEINGKTVKANIIDFNLGVNKGATVMATNPVIGEAVSGWDYVNENVNNDSMEKIQKIAGERLENMQTELNTKIALRTSNPPNKTEALKKLETEIKTLSQDIATIKELSDQITAIWEDGSYSDAGNEPYKLASRVALLSHLLGGGTVFNCKSGKDRTAQLDAEVKFLAFQIRTSNGTVPKPGRKRTNLEKIQFATFIFFDESRRKMQEFNTGYGGSKLVGQPALYGNFTPSTGDTKYSKKNMAATIKQFLGLSKAVSS